MGDNIPAAATNVPVTPAYDGAAVTLDDSNDLPNNSRALFIGTGGNLVVITRGGTTLTFKNVPNGTILPLRVSRVKSTNTTASDIIALF